MIFFLTLVIITTILSLCHDSTKIIFSELFLTVYSNHFELQNAQRLDDTERSA